MSTEEKRIEKAKSYFKLPNVFNLDDLKRAYEISKKNIDNMNKQSEKDSAPFRFSSPDIDSFYLILYKELMINHIKRLVLRDVNFKEVNGEIKTYIYNLDKKYLDFYNRNSIYSSKLGMLFNVIRSEFKIFEGINIANATSVEEVDVVVEKFASSIEETYKKFAEQMISEVKKDATYKPNNIIYEVDMSKITSIVSLIIETYNIVQTMFDKKSVLKEFMETASNYEKMLGKEEELTDEDIQKRQLIHRTALNYYSKLLKERNANEFIRLYDECILYISQIIEVSSVKTSEEETKMTLDEEQNPHTPGGRK